MTAFRIASQELPQPSVDEELLSIIDAGLMKQDRHAALIAYLDQVMIPDKGETAVPDFVVELFNLLGYERRERLARRRVNFSLLICGEDRRVKADVCLIDISQRNILLVVHADKRLKPSDPAVARAQLVAKAVAAFNKNNAEREAAGLTPLVEKASFFVSLWTFFS